MIVQYILRSKDSRECWDLLSNYLRIKVNNRLDFTIDNVRSTLIEGGVNWRFDFYRNFAGCYDNKIIVKFKNKDKYFIGENPINVVIWYRVQYDVWENCHSLYGLFSEEKIIGYLCDVG